MNALRKLMASNNFGAVLKELHLCLLSARLVGSIQQEIIGRDSTLASLGGINAEYDLALGLG